MKSQLEARHDTPAEQAESPSPYLQRREGARKRDLVRSVLAPGEDAGILLTEEDLEALFQPLAP